MRKSSTLTKRTTGRRPWCMHPEPLPEVPALPADPCPPVLRLTPERLHAVQAQLGYSFNDAAYLRQALAWRTPANERLEFLGDKVLGLCVAHWLSTTRPEWGPGPLTIASSRLVCKGTLAQVVAPAWGLTMTDEPHNHQWYCDAVEAVIGALFLDSQDWQLVAGLLCPLLTPVLERVAAEGWAQHTQGRGVVL